MQGVDHSYAGILRVSGPIIIGLVAQNLMVVIDTAFLGRLGEVTLGAAAIGGIFYLCLVMLGTGFSVGVQILVGRRNGEGKFLQIGQVFDLSVYFMLALALVLFFFLTFAAPGLLKWFMHSEGVLNESLLYLSNRRFGFFFGFQVLLFNAFYTGITRTRLLIASTSFMAVLNILLDYGLIFGHFGLPAMGIAGAAIATNIAEMLTFVFFLIAARLRHVISFYRLFRLEKINWVVYRSLLKVASPVMFQYFLSFAAWFIFFLIIEQIGETALAASNITRSFYMLLMIPVWGLSSATNTLVSNLIGQGRSADVIPLIKKVMQIGLATTLVLVLFNWIYPYQIIRFFTDDMALTEATIPLFRVVSVALLAFAAGMVMFSGLSGTGKTLVALKIEVLSIMFYLLTAFFLAVVLDAPASVVWLVEVVYFLVLGIASFLYLRSGRWKVFKI